MRLTSKLSAMLTLLSSLAMMLMFFGCVLSFFDLSIQRAEFRVQLMADAVDSALFSQTTEKIDSWLHRVMNP
ncbi:RNase E specificity factor CsrD, partial [Erwinia amylovora]|nr:RNase E specificity factor CsrD [Erwinia amylovora]